MQIIVEQNYYFKQLFGQQTAKLKTKYRFHHQLVCLDQPEGLFLHHVLSKELLLLTKDEAALWHAGEYDGNDVWQRLIAHWFLVPEDFDEFATVEQYYATAKLLKHNDGLTQYLILPTTDCNARCFYCFERGIEPLYMTPQTAADVADYIVKTCSRTRSINIRWFGGEPLCNVPAIDIICTRLHENKIKFSGEVITNGYLWTPELLDKAKTLWNVRRIQITLDGTESVYNRVKNFIYKDDPSPFKRVIQNIQTAISKDIYVKIRLNMDRHNYDNLYELISLLVPIVQGKNAGIYVSTLKDVADKGLCLHTREQRIDLKKQLQELQNFMVQKGVLQRYTLNNATRLHQCMADSDVSVSISPEGNLGRCEHFVETESMGNIYDGITRPEVIEMYKERWRPIPECHSCPFWAICYMKLKRCIEYQFQCEAVDRTNIELGYRRHILATYQDYLVKKTQRTNDSDDFSNC